ncbi:MAG: hypothetical protein ACOC8E_02800 [Planctomycetota bacterium]
MTTAPDDMPDLLSLGKGEPFDSADDLLRAAADRAASHQDRLDADVLFGRMTSPDEYSANLRGRLLLMEVACPELERPDAFYLMGTAREVTWRGAPVRLLLLALYRPDALRYHVVASQRVYHETLTADRIRHWLEGEAWPASPPSC